MRLSHYGLPIVFLLALSVPAPSIQAAESAPTAANGLSVAVAFAPVASNPHAFSCSAEITDLATGKCLFTPRIQQIKGERGTATMGDDKASVVLEVEVNKAGTSGSYAVTYRKAGQVVTIQKGSIAIK